MKNPPPKLYRAVKGEKAPKNHWMGTLWFRSHVWLRNQKNGDELEGIGSFEVEGQVLNRNVSDDHPVHPVYCLSFSETPEAARTMGRDSHEYQVLELLDPAGLRQMIQSKLLSPEFIKVEWIQMEYTKTLVVTKDPGSGVWHRQYHCKPEKFKMEREWRLQILFKKNSFRIQNDTLEFRWGRDIGQYFEVLPK